MGERRRALSYGRAAVRLLLGALVLVVFGLIPGSVTRSIVLERTALPLPPSPDRVGQLDVTVTSAETRKPIAHARVRALALVNDVAFLASSGETDADGRVVLRSLPRGALWVLADADGYARGSTQKALGTGSDSVDLALGRGHALDVVVEDDLGKPVPLASVEIIGADPLPIGARVDASGHGEVKRLGEGPWTVRAEAPGFEDAVERGVREGSVARLVLRKMGALVVSVSRVDGRPASLAEVQIAGSSLWPARATHTQEDGTVRIGGLGAGSYAVRATSGALASPTELGILLSRGEEKRVALVLAEGLFASVRVIDAEMDPNPVEHARVTLVEGGLSPFPLEGVTDKEGSVRLGPIAPGPAVLSAQADGFVPTGAIDAPPDGKTVTITMMKGGVVEGRVLDVRGRPVDGATIEIVGSSLTGGPIDDDPRSQAFRKAQFDGNLAGARPLIPSGELGVVPGPVPAIPHGPALTMAAPGGTAPVQEPWVTRDDGTYTASPASPGRIRVVVHHPAYLDGLSDAVTLTPGASVTVDLVLHEGGALEGRVVDTAGRPVGGASVTMAALRGSMERMTHAASDGTFAFAAVPDGVVVTASTGDEDDFRVARGTVAVPDGAKATLTLTLPDQRPALELHVKDDRGFPVAAAQVSIGSIDPAVPLRTTVFTDAHGDATAAGAAGVALRVEVSAPGHANAAREVTPAERSVEVTLDPAVTVTGMVREDRSGLPIRSATVTLSVASGVRRAETDATGRFRLPDVAAGAARLRVRAAGRVTYEGSVTVENGRDTDVGNIDLPEEGTVEGTVVGPRGDPVAGARVGRDHVPTYVVASTRDPSLAVTDSRGRFRLGGLGQGSVSLEAYAPDVGRSSVVAVEVTAGRATKDVTLHLQPEAERAVEPAGSGGVAVTLGELSGDPPELAIVGVSEGSEAERAGLAAGDVLLAVDGTPVTTLVDARSRLSGPVGDDVVITRRRDDRTESLRVPREAVRR